jgi:aminomethyltransferase
MSDDLKRTPLVAEHQALGGRMVDFAGWYMPVQYSSVVAEHEAVRTKAGLFDVSHMGELRIKGKQACDFVSYVTTNNPAKLVDGQAQYSIFTNEKGTVIDDLLVYRENAEDYLLVVNAANQDSDAAWLAQHIGDFDAELINEGPQTAQLALQGPLALAIASKLTEVDLNAIGYYFFTHGQVAGVQCLISRTGYTGEDGLELYCNADDAVTLWKALLEAGEHDGLIPVGLGARDTLRLEARMPLCGSDMGDSTTPLEAGLGFAVKTRKKARFLGQDVLKQQKADGLKRKLVGFVLVDKGIARHGYPVIDAEGNIVGEVTSGSHSPTLGKSIGLAYVPVELSDPDTTIHIRIRKKVVAAKVIKGPFYQRSKASA